MLCSVRLCEATGGRDFLFEINLNIPVWRMLVVLELLESTHYIKSKKC